MITTLSVEAVVVVSLGSDVEGVDATDVVVTTPAVVSLVSAAVHAVTVNDNKPIRTSSRPFLGDPDTLCLL
jgi:hypothetical protein